MWHKAPKGTQAWKDKGLFRSYPSYPGAACSIFPLHATHDPSTSGCYSGQILNQTTSDDYKWIRRQSGNSLHICNRFLPLLPQRTPEHFRV